MPVPPVTYLAAGLILVGVALVVGAFVGRPTGFIGVAAALILIAGISTVNTTDAATTTTTSTVTSTVELPPAIDVAGNDYTLDLSELSATEDSTTTINMTGGDVVVILPKSGNYTIAWSVLSGKVTQPDGTYTSTTGERDVSRDPNKPMTTIKVEVLWGNLVIV